MADLTPYTPPDPGDSSEARDWLKHELTAYPYVSEACREFLDGLHWRQRAAVIFAYGEKLTQDIAAYRLNISERTLRQDLVDACAKLEEIFRT